MKAQNVLLIRDLKHNLLSVGKLVLERCVIKGINSCLTLGSAKSKKKTEEVWLQ